MTSVAQLAFICTRRCQRSLCGRRCFWFLASWFSSHRRPTARNVAPEVAVKRGLWRQDLSPVDTEHEPTACIAVGLRPDVDDVRGERAELRVVTSSVACVETHLSHRKHERYGELFGKCLLNDKGAYICLKH